MHVTQSSIPEVSVEDLNKTMEAKEDACIILDVRTTEEYSRGHIEGSLHLPVDEVESKIEKAIPQKSAKVFLFCLSGHRSLFAAEVMASLGYTDIYNVTNGMLAWRAEGFPVTV
jgi:rhodanese-related sulfurtransferase